jgi:hypothetical protein
MNPDPQDRAREGLEHLQAAGRELVAAARAALDVVEELIDDPEAMASVTGAVGSLGELMRDAANRLLAHRGNGADPDATEGPAVERIRVE